MKKIGGIIIFILGLILSLIGIFLKGNIKLIFFIYGIPMLILGLIISLNKNEDKIEEINYKGGKK